MGGVGVPYFDILPTSKFAEIMNAQTALLTTISSTLTTMSGVLDSVLNQGLLGGYSIAVSTRTDSGGVGVENFDLLPLEVIGI
jgi:hypothetical protein